MTTAKTTWLLAVVICTLGGGSMGCEVPAVEQARSNIDIPDGWTCDKDHWEDGTCTCGCGVQDADCAANDRALCKEELCAEDWTAGTVIKRVPRSDDPRLCANSTCGDGYVEQFDEGCDDGDNTDANGCMADCFHTSEEEDWICGNNGEGCRLAVCGNGIWDYWFENCDDGNVVPGDGCDDGCEIEDFWDCPSPEDVFAWAPVAGPCFRPVCGNDAVERGEACDDGNLVVGDGCSDSCTAEAGWVCEPECRAITCGDDIPDDSELCDDGNTDSGDGCSAGCRPEACTRRNDDDECTGVWAELPAAWNLDLCEIWRFGESGSCTCGCGAHDVDCPDVGVMTIESCQDEPCHFGVDPDDLDHCLPHG